MYDAIVVGGSYAGLSAAMQLARARRLVLVIDSGLPRNRFTRAAHGFLGQDGKAPFAILAEARRQLLLYPNIELLQGEAVNARKGVDGFIVEMKDGKERKAARLVLATGLRDELPAVAGLQERWGATVLHCPYCHGYEVRDQALGVLANHPMAIHVALMMPDWGPTTYLTQARFTPDKDQAACLAARGVRIEETPVVELLGEAPELQAVRLSDGRVVPLRAIFTQPKTHMASPLAEQLGCAFDEGPSGRYVRVDEWKQTTVWRVYAAGDAASPMHNATLAACSGVSAGIGAHQSLLGEVVRPAPQDVELS